MFSWDFTFSGFSLFWWLQEPVWTSFWWLLEVFGHHFGDFLGYCTDIEISMNFQYTNKSPKWGPKTSKSVQNEGPRGTWSHQNNENVEKVKSNENTCICNTFERLGHQNSREFPFKNHQKTWLQSKCDFELFKSEKIWKSDAEGSPMGDPKSIKNH